MAALNYEICIFATELLSNSASNNLMVLLSLKLDARPKLTPVNPKLTLELKFGSSLVHCHVKLWRGPSVMTFAVLVHQNENVGEQGGEGCHVMRTFAYKFLESS